MLSKPSLVAVVVFSSLLFGCGGGTKTSDDGGGEIATSDGGGGGEIATSDGGSGEDPDNCPAGKVRIVSKMQHYDAFCGQPCASTSDCPSGMACVFDIFGIPDPGIPFCVSDSVPPSDPWGGIQVDGPTSTCVDSMTLGQRYVNQKTGIAGYERIACPQGCVESNPGDAGLGWQTTARCL